jgi:predicted DNA binding CopG/RHH family protein
MSGKEPQARTIVERLEDIPVFHNEDEEHAFWAEHEFSDDLWERAEPFAPDELPSPRSATRPVAIRFDEHTLERIKVLARKRHKGYQTLLKEFVAERLYEEEKREGLVAGSGCSPQ